MIVVHNAFVKVIIVICCLLQRRVFAVQQQLDLSKLSQPVGFPSGTDGFLKLKVWSHPPSLVIGNLGSPLSAVRLIFVSSVSFGRQRID